ncbi:tetratricopeptide repeat protein 9A isoform X3 [Dunckerocampus dactyliophorus]|uniref:tetratricopeptide repeat protein 9A isoform X3 n=1 Tax=Dunckerocampus dactyliophorus TaxID=161453 RepID=UPI002407618C|nr:tetratricopeptide repeat protein 9A isoform X3 [Dunckerocampus dactyliophorus]
MSKTSVIQAAHDGGPRVEAGSGGAPPRLQQGAQIPSGGSGNRARDAWYQQVQQQRHQGGTMLKQPAHHEPADVVRRALDFKCQGTQCYKDKKYREAIGKYHRALLEIKGLCRVLGDPDVGGSKSPSPLLAAISKSSPLTEEQKGAMENAELECYNSLAGTSFHTPLHPYTVPHYVHPYHIHPYHNTTSVHPYHTTSVRTSIRTPHFIQPYHNATYTVPHDTTLTRGVPPGLSICQSQR